MKKFISGHKNDSFRLLKDIDTLKKGKVFQSFGGLVSGIIVNKNQVIKFNDPNWFKLVKKRSVIIDKNFIPNN